MRISLATLLGGVALVGLSASAVAMDEEVRITKSLRPAQLEIETGTTVTWRNVDDERHRVRSEDGPVRFDSGNLERGESFTFRFDVEGSYSYYDQRNRDDIAYFGMITVGGAALDADAPLSDSGSVSIIDKSFQPGSLRLAAGGTVAWSNDDGEAHTVTSTEDAFDSGILNGDEAFSQTFDEPGSYPYFCLIHPEMRGTITIAAAPEATVPPEDPAVGDPDPAPADDDTAGPAGGATGEPIAVSVIERSFQPETIVVDEGDAVLWANDDTEGHTVTALDGDFNSGVMTVGDEFAKTFETAGTYDYFCAIHPEMTGSVSVVAGEELTPGT